MVNTLKDKLDERYNIGGNSRLRLQTIVRLRWIGVIGQLLAVSVVYFGLGFDLPIGACLVFIAMSAWVNVYLAVRFPGRHRLSNRLATMVLSYDVLQLAALLYLTGGVSNPFVMLIVAPVTVSAATLPMASTVGLGVLSLSAAAVLVFEHLPLPWHGEENLVFPIAYKIGVLAAVAACMPFLALYVWRLTKESAQMAVALNATELVLAREQKLHALDGLAAAAAHELGTPLSTITLVTNEMARQLPKESPYFEDVMLLRGQAQRCREILQKLTRQRPSEDPLHGTLTMQEILHEAAAPYMAGAKIIRIDAKAATGVVGPDARQPVGLRRPGVIYGLGNIIENGADFARTRVEISAEWDANNAVITISDDGPGFQPDIIDTLGEPYVTTRPQNAAGRREGSGEKLVGLGLGFFIAKTLLERSGARLELANKFAPLQGAVVRIKWPRAAFEADIGDGWMPVPKAIWQGVPAAAPPIVEEI